MLLRCSPRYSSRPCAPRVSSSASSRAIFSRRCPASLSSILADFLWRSTSFCNCAGSASFIFFNRLSTLDSKVSFSALALVSSCMSCFLSFCQAADSISDFSLPNSSLISLLSHKLSKQHQGLLRAWWLGLGRARIKQLHHGSSFKQIELKQS